MNKKKLTAEENMTISLAVGRRLNQRKTIFIYLDNSNILDNTTELSMILEAMFQNFCFIEDSSS